MASSRSSVWLGREEGCGRRIKRGGRERAATEACLTSERLLPARAGGEHRREQGVGELSPGSADLDKGDWRDEA